MKKFSLTELSREQFLAWLGGERRASHATSAKLREQGMIALLSDESEAPKESQPVIVVPSDGLRDFFAFVGTYVTTYRPFSAFFRVVPADMTAALEQRQRPTLDMAEGISKLVVGAAFSEIYLRSAGRTTINKIQLPLVAASLSATLGQAVVAGYPASVFDWLTTQWSAIHRRESDLTSDGADPEQIASIWKLISVSISEVTRKSGVGIQDRHEEVISRFLASAIHGRGIDKTALLLLGSSIPTEINLAKAIAAPREERIRIFNDFVEKMRSSSHDTPMAPFLAGFLLAISGNGSFDLLPSGRELLSRSPISVIWFGICAALFDESNVLTIANCAGRRFVRDLRRPQGLFEVPQADLNSYEYLLFRRDVGSLEQVNSKGADVLEIELLANVNTFASKSEGGRESHLAQDIEVLSGSLQEIRAVAERAQRMLRSVTSRQAELFRSDEKPRGRPR